jgi:two-component system, LytTR family, response regulator
MPEVDGFEVVRLVGAERMPAVVFVTAFDQYALRAFEVHAVDYLLKPVVPERLAEALDRTRARLRQHDDDAGRRLHAVLEQLGHPPDHAERLVVKDGERFVLIRTEEVDWLESADNYVRLHVGKRAFLLRGTLAAVESRLDPRRFLRIHRSTIVNLDRVQDFQLWFQGEYIVTLRDGTRLNVSRAHRGKLLDLMNLG